MIVFWPDSECRMRDSDFGSTVTDTAASNPPPVTGPYTTAGSRPAARCRLASFLPLSVRFSA